MTEIEKLKQKKLREEEERKRKMTKQDYNRVITEDGTLSSFNFSDNYKPNNK